jgi:hypothetical protein
MRMFKINEISAVDRPAQAGARMTIMKCTGSAMTPFTKAQAETAWSKALSAYAAKHKLSDSAAALDFARTPEAQVLYEKVQRASRPRTDAIAKASALANVSAEELAKSAFPEMSTADAIVAWLATDAGKEFYTDSAVLKRKAERA